LTTPLSVCGRDQEEYDANLEDFLCADTGKNIPYNNAKSVFSTCRLAIFGYVIEEGVIRPDPEQLHP